MADDYDDDFGIGGEPIATSGALGPVDETANLDAAASGPGALTAPKTDDTWFTQSRMQAIADATQRAKDNAAQADKMTAAMQLSAPNLVPAMAHPLQMNPLHISVGGKMMARGGALGREGYASGGRPHNMGHPHLASMMHAAQGAVHGVMRLPGVNSGGGMGAIKVGASHPDARIKFAAGGALDRRQHFAFGGAPVATGTPGLPLGAAPGAPSGLPLGGAPMAGRPGMPGTPPGAFGPTALPPQMQRPMGAPGQPQPQMQAPQPPPFNPGAIGNGQPRNVASYANGGLMDMMGQIRGGLENAPPRNQGMLRTGLQVGPGNGVSDSIHTRMANGGEVATGAGEYVLPSRVVSHWGGGSTEAGASAFDALVKHTDRMIAHEAQNAPAPKR